jgi:repressor LexA
MALTRRQREILDFVSEFIAANGHSPSLLEIGARFGLSSPATVHKHVQRLVDKGLLRKSPHSARSVEPCDAAPSACRIPLLGVVAAGRPIESFSTGESLDVPADLVRRPESTYALRVRGDSMIEDGIHDGDLVIVESAVEAHDGETVVALVHGSEATLKRLRRAGRMVELLPANATHAVQRYPAADVTVQGIVRGLLRRFGDGLPRDVVPRAVDVDSPGSAF